MWPVASAMLTDMEDAGAVASQETKTQILRAVIEFRLESDEHVTPGWARSRRRSPGRAYR